MGLVRAGSRVRCHAGLRRHAHLLYPQLDRVETLPAPQAAALRVALGLTEWDEANRLLASVGTLSLLTDLAEEAPLLCVVADLQWIDPEPLAVLLFAASRLRADRIAMLFTLREAFMPFGSSTGGRRSWLEPLHARVSRKLTAIPWRSSSSARPTTVSSRTTRMRPPDGWAPCLWCIGSRTSFADRSPRFPWTLAVRSWWWPRTRGAADDDAARHRGPGCAAARPDALQQASEEFAALWDKQLVAPAQFKATRLVNLAGEIELHGETLLEPKSRQSLFVFTAERGNVSAHRLQELVETSATTMPVGGVRSLPRRASSREP